MDNIKEIIKNVIGDIVDRRANQDDRVIKLWQEILDENNFKGTRIEGLKDDCLYVLVDSPARLYQLKTKQNTLIKQLKNDIPNINRINFKIGKI